MKKKILLIDDDEELCEEITEILSDEGYRVTTAFDGLSGNRLIRKYDYDLIILDIKMPGLSGFDILQGIKGQNKELKVIILTGRPLNKNLPKEQNYNDKEERILGLADGIIGKPFDIEVLLGKIKELANKI
ncbi:MAG: response regulator transcription factor [Elusimicrobiota bacterium]|nr:response regulator transcription factor [Elusimicrobiota bacterium]MDH5662425.1 response regulator transcription factor [Elusimicrobiota bacterium]